MTCSTCSSCDTVKANFNELCHKHLHVHLRGIVTYFFMVVKEAYCFLAGPSIYYTGACNTRSIAGILWHSALVQMIELLRFLCYEIIIQIH